MRSRAAAGTLLNAGFDDVYSMEGGIKAWDGMVAEGTPDAGRVYFSRATNAEELTALAWLMEDGSRRFYSGIADGFDDEELTALFRSLTKAEEHHKMALLDVFREISEIAPGDNFPFSLFPDAKGKDVMEGGMNVADALEWARGRSHSEILELAMALEINAYDLYMTMEHEIDREQAKKIFRVLAHEEKQHLERLSSKFEMISKGGS